MAPNRCTGITQRTRGASAGASSSAVSRWESGSTSTSTGVAPDRGDRLGGGDEGVGRHEHLVAGPDLQRTQREHERLGAGGDADGEVGLAVVGELALERLDVVAERERAVLGDFADRPQQLLEQRGVGVVHTRERHLRPRGTGSCVATWWWTVSDILFSPPTATVAGAASNRISS